MKLKVLENGNIRLRPITIEDTDLIVSWRNKDYVRNNFIFREKFTKDMHNNWMKTMVLTGKVIQYIIEEKENKRPIGSVYFRDIDINNMSAEYGIFIGEEDARGKGYGKMATKLFSEYGLNELELHRIFLRVLENNERAYRTYETVGFIKEGIFKDMVRIDGKHCNVVFMAIVKKL